MQPDDRAYAYTLPEAGRRLGVSRHTVARMVAAGELPAISVYGLRRITHQAILDYLEEASQPKTAWSRTQRQLAREVRV